MISDERLEEIIAVRSLTNTEVGAMARELRERRAVMREIIYGIEKLREECAATWVQDECTRLLTRARELEG